MRTWIAVCALWVVYTLLESVQFYARQSPAAPGLTFVACAQMLMLRACVLWIPLTLCFVAVARRVPLTHGLWPWGAIKLGAALLAALAWQATGEWLTDPLTPYFYAGWPSALPSLPEYLLQSVNHYHTRVYMIVFLCYAWNYLQTTHASRLRIAALESGVTHARLDALSARLNPKFLFNALDSIAVLTHRDPDAADRTLMSLSSLLRFNLAGGVHEVTVADEIAFAQDYFAVEQARPGAAFDVHWVIDDGCEQALVPALIVQALAEPSLATDEPARAPLRIELRRSGARLAVSVSSAATSHTPTAPPAELALRLRELYGDDYALAAYTADGRRVARAELPWRTNAAPAVAA